MPDWKEIVRARVLAAGIRPERTPDDLVDELAQHAEEAYRAARAMGKSEAESRSSVEAERHDLPALVRAARLGRARRIPPTSEPERPGRLSFLSIFARDVAHGARLLLARPAFTAIAVVTLALGIGANTAIVSVVYSLFLAPLPFPEPNQLVRLWEQDVERRDQRIVSAPNWKDCRTDSTSFQSMTIWEILNFNVAGGPDPEQVGGMRVSAGAFTMFGIAPEIGRTFTEAEDLPGHRVVVISHALWQRRFDARADAIGQPVKLNGEPYDVIGVINGAPFRQGQAVGLNMPVLIFTCGLTLVTGLLFSLAPMLGVSRIDPGATLKAGGDRGGTSRFTILRTTLVGVEVALAVIVLAAAGLMIKSVSQLLAVDPGVDARHVLLMSIALPQKDFYGPPVRTSGRRARSQLVARCALGCGNEPPAVRRQRRTRFRNRGQAGAARERRCQRQLGSDGCSETGIDRRSADL